MLMIVRGEEESAGLPVFELGKQDLCQLDRKRQIAIPPAGLKQGQDPINQERIVIEVGVEMSPTFLVGSQQSPSPPEGCLDEVQGALCRLNIIFASKDPPG